MSMQRWPVGTRGALWLAFLLVIGHYVALYVVGGCLTIALGITDRREIWQAPPAAFIINLAVGAFEIGLVLCVWMRRYARLSFREAGWRDFSARDITYGLIGFTALALTLVCNVATDEGFTGAITYITNRIAHYTPQQRAFFALMGIIAAVPEETIFRGILQPTLQAKLGRWSGIVVTALIFAVYHFLFAIPQLVGKICFGLVLGLVREKTGTLWASAIAHTLAWAIIGPI